ncbi:hypothetical protein Bbelb_439810 [Branchiostoma belcheri]|nr:hypothetical protein Bbelb_439810 [Branchiostoma belcheri]
MAIRRQRRQDLVRTDCGIVAAVLSSREPGQLAFVTQCCVPERTWFFRPAQIVVLTIAVFERAPPAFREKIIGKAGPIAVFVREEKVADTSHGLPPSAENDECHGKHGNGRL